MHIFITGKKGIGKSTLLKAVVEKAMKDEIEQKSKSYKKITGFLTKRIWIESEERFATFLLPVRGSYNNVDEPSEENKLFYCDDIDNIKKSKERFEILGVEALSHINDGDIVLMDELGKIESLATAFKQRVLDVLDGRLGCANVYGVLQKCESDFIKSISERDDVKLINLTLENRDKIYREMCEKSFDET